MKVFKYVGPHDAVDVPALDAVVKHGQTVRVENPDVSAALEGQADWEHIPQSKPAGKPATPGKD